MEGIKFNREVERGIKLLVMELFSQGNPLNIMA